MTNLHYRNNRHHLPLIQQGGFTLLEIMIALFIGFFLLFSLTTLFVNTKQTFLNQRLLAELQNNQILAMNVISNVAQSAGYSPSLASTDQKTAQSNAFNFYLETTNPTVTGNNTWLTAKCAAIAAGWTRATIPTSDNFIKINSCAQDCTGNGVPSTCTSQVPVAFFVCNDNQKPAQPHLVCSVNNAIPQPLTDGVSSLSVQYGIDPTPLCTGIITTGCRQLQNGTAQFYSSSSNINIAKEQVISLYVTLSFVNPLGTTPTTLPISRAIGLMGRI